MSIELRYVPHQPYIWARVFDSGKEIGCIKNPRGTFDILVSGGNGRWIEFDIHGSMNAAYKCRDLYNAIQQSKRESIRGICE